MILPKRFVRFVNGALIAVLVFSFFYFQVLSIWGFEAASNSFNDNLNQALMKSQAFNQQEALRLTLNLNTKAGRTKWLTPTLFSCGLEGSQNRPADPVIHHLMPVKPTSGSYSTHQGTLNYVHKNGIRLVSDRLNLKQWRELSELRLDITAEPPGTGTIGIACTGSLTEIHTIRHKLAVNLADFKKHMAYNIKVLGKEICPADASYGYIVLIPDVADGTGLTIKEPEAVFVDAIAKAAQCKPRYISRGNELRFAVSTPSPGEMKYELDLPLNPRLRFGVGLMKPVPTTVKFYINDSEASELIHSEEIVDASLWHDFLFDLSKWRDKRVNLKVVFFSDRENYVFISNAGFYSKDNKSTNVILVLEDALRADHLSTYGYFRKTTPVKDELARGGVVFSHAFSQATKTRPSVPSLMTSLYPAAIGVWWFWESLDENYLTLAEIFRENGFHTAAFIQNGNAGVQAGLEQGFNQLWSTSAKFNKKTKDIYKESFPAWLEKYKEQSFFVYLHILDPHGVYQPDAPFDRWYREIAPGKTPVAPDYVRHDPPYVINPTVQGRRALYDGEIKENDYYFKFLIDKLKELNLFKNTLIVFLSDHGEHLGEHGLWEHHPPGYVQGIRVPLIFSWPDKIKKPTVIEDPVQLIDVAPTILDLMGIRYAHLPMAGVSLKPFLTDHTADLSKRRIVWSDEVMDLRRKSENDITGSAFFTPWHFILSKSIRGEFKAINFRRDPGEIGFLSPLLEPFFKNKFKKFAGQVKRTNLQIYSNLAVHKNNSVSTDPNMEEQIRSLGYM